MSEVRRGAANSKPQKQTQETGTGTMQTRLWVACCLYSRDCLVFCFHLLLFCCCFFRTPFFCCCSSHYTSNEIAVLLSDARASLFLTCGPVLPLVYLPLSLIFRA
jgi:hypothetical protein